MEQEKVLTSKSKTYRRQRSFTGKRGKVNVLAYLKNRLPNEGEGSCAKKVKLKLTFSIAHDDGDPCGENKKKMAQLGSYAVCENRSLSLLSTPLARGSRIFLQDLFTSDAIIVFPFDRFFSLAPSTHTDVV